MAAGVRNVVGCDTSGAIYRGRTEHMNWQKEWYAEHTNPNGERPNQINNVLCFSGIFRGAVACRASCINEEMKLAAANAIAGTIRDDELAAEYIMPSVFDRGVAERVARDVEDHCDLEDVEARAVSTCLIWS